MEETGAKLILALAELLGAKQVETDVIDRALDMISSEFAFDGGLVYELDQYNVLHLKEHSLRSGFTYQLSFDLDDIDADYRSYLAQEIFVLLEQGQSNTAAEEALLQLFAARSLVVGSVVDENLQIYGLLVFVRQTVRPLTAAEHRLLTTVLPMFGRYLGVRVYRNRLAFASNSLESILDNTGIDIYVNDFYNHDILYANKSMAATYGVI
ncbi:MAG: hypothetical protein LUC29_00390, partial [Acidaminococcaceae bacterium]|nr:hypothetical protein [Acidaminococcaceae bacterium]